MGIERARLFADMVQAAEDFELVTAPELNILTYRYVPAWLQTLLPSLAVNTRTEVNALLDLVTIRSSETSARSR